MAKNLGFQPSRQLPMDLSRVSATDMTHLVELFGGPNVLNLCTVFQKFPGCGLEMLSENDLTNVLQKLGIKAETTGGDSTTQLQRITKFQTKAATILKYLDDCLKNTHSGEEVVKNDSLSPVKRESNSEDQACCVKCKKTGSDTELSTCSLPCPARFHSECRGRVIAVSANKKLTCCLPCTGILLLCSLTPGVLKEDDQELMDKVRQNLFPEQNIAKLNFPLPSQSPLQFGPAFLKPGFGFNTNTNGNETYFKQLNQLQLLGHQLSGTFPSFINPNANIALAFQQQFENTQNVFQLWGSLGVNQGTTNSNKRKGDVPEDPPSRNRQKCGQKSPSAQAARSSFKSNENKSRGDPKKVNLNDKQKCKQRRTRWLSTELETLWRGILLHGNRWYEVKNNLPGRTYYQVKDKGRRLLYTHGWKTGRLKNDNNGAYEDAKAIARLMLAGDGTKPSAAATEVSTA